MVLNASSYEKASACNFIKKETLAEVFFCEFCQVSKNTFSTKHLQKQSFLDVLEKDVLKICSKFTGEHPCESAISIKLLCNFIEITLQDLRSPVNVLHFSEHLFPKNTSGSLILHLWWLLLSCDNQYNLTVL